jgi:hypothetical protein
MSQHTSEISAEQWLDVVRQKVGAIRFGSVQIIVHEDRVTLIESTEKTRFAHTSASKSKPAILAA